MFATAALTERLAQNRQSLRFAWYGMTEALPFFNRYPQPQPYWQPTPAPHTAGTTAPTPPAFSPHPSTVRTGIWIPRPASVPHFPAPAAARAPSPPQVKSGFVQTCKAASGRGWRMVRKPVLISGLALATVSALAVAAVQVNYQLHQADIPALKAQLSLKMATPVLDGEGVFLGVLPPPSNDYGVTLENAGSALDDLPDSCYLILKNLEDKNAETWRYAGGVDWAGFLNVKRLARGHGMSSLPMQLSSLATGAKGKLSKYERKAQELANAATLMHAFGGHRAMATAYASIAPYTIVNGDLIGLHSAAAAFFDKPVEALSVSECAVLMALPKMPLRANSANAGQAWRKVKARAIHGLKKVYGAAAQADIDLVNAMPLPVLKSSDTLAGATRQAVMPFSRSLRFESQVTPTTSSLTIKE